MNQWLVHTVMLKVDHPSFWFLFQGLLVCLLRRRSAATSAVHTVVDRWTLASKYTHKKFTHAYVHQLHFVNEEMHKVSLERPSQNSNQNEISQFQNSLLKKHYEIISENSYEIRNYLKIRFRMCNCEIRLGSCDLISASEMYQIFKILLETKRNNFVHKNSSNERVQNQNKNKTTLFWRDFFEK